MRKGLLIALALASAPAFASERQPLPGLAEGSLSLKKSALSLSYNPKHKQADWVFYGLGPQELRNCVSRDDRFQADPAVPHHDSAQLEDYKGSGFDRGHLSPAADNKFAPKAMKEAFFLSNISPQPAGFNRGIWATLENLVRAWALKTGGLWVTTGPVLENHLRAIGSSRVSVPTRFYKVLLTKNGGQRRLLAFMLPVNASGDLARYALPVDELEGITGIDFNQGVPEEDELEESVELRGWNFRETYTPRPCKDPKKD